MLGFASVLILVIAYFNVTTIIQSLPDSDFKLRLGLLVYKNKIEALIPILNESGYTKIFWIKDREIRAGLISNGKLKWDKSPDLENFINKAKSNGFETMLTSKSRNGNWLFSGYQEVMFLNESRTNIKTLHAEYSYGVKPELELCNNDLIEKQEEGKCYLSLNSNWFIYKYWFTYDSNLTQT